MMILRVWICSILFTFQENRTLVFIVKDEEDIKIYFDNYLLPTLVFSEISSAPEISFESTYEILFNIGRSMFEYDIVDKILKIKNKTNPIELNWRSFVVAIHYNIVKTNVFIFNGTNTTTYLFEGDIWQIINTGDALYLFSDSINMPFCVHKIDNTGMLSKLFTDLAHSYIAELEYKTSLSPLLKFLPNQSKKKDQTAILFIHGGPSKNLETNGIHFLLLCLKTIMMYMFLSTEVLLLLTEKIYLINPSCDL